MSSLLSDASFHRNTPSLSVTSPGPQFEEFRDPHNYSTDPTELRSFHNDSTHRYTLYTQAIPNSIDLEAGAGVSTQPDDGESDQYRMKRTTRSQAHAANGSDAKAQQNGSMNSPLEHRRRYSAADGTASMFFAWSKAARYTLTTMPRPNRTAHEHAQLFAG